MTPSRKIAKYRKFAAAVVGAVLVTIPLVWDLHVTATEAVTLVTVWAAACGVRQIPNAR